MLIKLNWGVSIGNEPIAFFATQSLADRMARHIANELNTQVNVCEFARTILDGEQVWISKSVKGRTVEYPICQSKWKSILEFVAARNNGRVRGVFERSKQLRVK